MRRLNVLPGITGYFKLMNGIPLNLKHGINMILNILKIGVLYLDFKIILKTPFALFSKKIKGI